MPGPRFLAVCAFNTLNPPPPPPQSPAPPTTLHEQDMQKASRLIYTQSDDMFCIFILSLQNLIAGIRVPEILRSLP